jgi:hypothetical protein
MADILTDALTGLNYTPADTGFGIAQQSVSAMTPQLITPYTSTGRAVGIGLGSILLQSLLGYQARQQAAQDTLAVNSLANQLQTLETPQARTDFIKGVGDTGYQSRLSNLATALTAQDLSSRQKIKDTVALETGKLKAMGEFYATPEGKAAREAELAQIRAEAEARRTPLDQVLEQERIKQLNRLALESTKQEGKKELLGIKGQQQEKLKQLAIEAASGDAEKKRAFDAEQKQLDRANRESLVKLRIELGADAEVEQKARLNALEMQFLAEDKDPKLARARALAIINEDSRARLLEKNDELIRNRQQEYSQQITERMKQRKELDLKYPTLTGKTKDAVADAGPFANLARDLAADIRKISSYPEYKAARNLAAIGDDNIKSRTADLIDRITRIRSGLATRGVEDERMETILLGDSTLGPQAVADLLDRVADDTLRVAADKLGAGTQTPAALAQLYREAATKRSKVPLQVQEYQASDAPDLASLQAELEALRARRKELEARKGIK